MKSKPTLRFRILSGKDVNGRWYNLEVSWDHHIVKVGDTYRENWSELSLSLQSWWVRPGYHNIFYDGPHPCISFGFFVIGWEPWGSGEWLEPEYVDGKRVQDS